MMYGLSDVGPSTGTTHQGAHAGQGMRNMGLVWGIENMVYVTLGHGSQGIGLEMQQRDRSQKDPFHVSAWGFSTKQQEPIFSSHKGLSVFCLLLPVSSDAKEWECPG